MIYLCNKCRGWFKTQNELKVHKCADVIKARLETSKPAVVEVETAPTAPVLPVKEDISTVKTTVDAITGNEDIEDTPDVELPTRSEMVDILKEKGIISDKRTVTQKSDEEIIEMYKQAIA